MAVVLDASVGVKLLVDEPGTDLARDFYLAQPDLIAPELFYLEVYSALFKKWRRDEYSDEQIRLAPPLIVGLVPFVSSSAELFSIAADISSATAHSIYDCTYLALAMRTDNSIATADDKLKRIAERLNFNVSWCGG